MISFSAPIHVVPKGRPRFGRGRTFTPKRTRDCEQAIALVARTHFSEPLQGPLSVEIVLSKARGDLDNRIKTVTDACNGIAWVDDRQIVQIASRVLQDREPFMSMSVAPFAPASSISTKEGPR